MSSIRPSPAAPYSHPSPPPSSTPSSVAPRSTTNGQVLVDTTTTGTNSRSNNFQPLPPPPSSPHPSSLQSLAVQRLRRAPAQPPTLNTSVPSIYQYHQQQQQHQNLSESSSVHLYAPSPVSAHPGAAAAATPVGEPGVSRLVVPGSAVSATLPYSTIPASPLVSARPTPISAPVMNSYNPQEWGRGTVGGAYVPHSASSASNRTRGTRELSGHEPALPSPPPPYTRSPSSMQHASPHSSSFMSQAPSPSTNYSDYNTPMSSATTASPSGPMSGFPSARAGPSSLLQQTSPTSFPPPPGAARDRSASRTKGMFSALASRVRATDAQSPETASPRAVNDAYGNRIPSGPGQSSMAGPSRATPAPIQAYPQQQQQQYQVQRQQLPIAPNSRRAASVGAVGPGTDRSQAGSNESGWEPGRRLPPPPPGPPPGSSGSRSQSLNRASEREQQPSGIYSPIPTRIAARPSQLETVPPTPADWVDDSNAGSRVQAQQAQSQSQPQPQSQSQPQSQDNSQQQQQRPTPAPENFSARAPLQLDTRAAYANLGRPNNFILSAIEPRSMQTLPGSSSSGSTSTAGAGGGNFERLSRNERGSIRERRSESRQRSREPMTAAEVRHDPLGQQLAEQAQAKAQAQAQAQARPANLVLATSNNTSSSLSRRPHVSKAQASPRTFSATTSPLLSAEQLPNIPASARNQQSSTERGHSRHEHPEPGSAPPDAQYQGVSDLSPIPTPFSADSVGPPPTAPSRLGKAPSNISLAEAVTPSGLPSASRESPGFLSARTSVSEQGGRSDGRPGSRNDGLLSTQPPSAQGHRPTSSKGSTTSNISREPRLDGFALASLDRFKAFISAEAEASNDREKLEIFADFFVAESRIRRDRYHDAFESLGSDVLDLTRDMWRTQTSSRRTRDAPGASPAVDTATATASGQDARQPPSLRTNIRTTASREPSSAGSASGSGGAPFTPRTEPDSPGSAQSQGRYRSDSHRQASYQPMLSPIPSMAMSTVPSGDEEDSRGRAPSRWWEQSSQGPSSIADGGVRKLERSKRESKYMGLPREARAALQFENAEPSPSFGNVTPGPSDAFANLGPNEYPAEKVGWHDQDTPSLSSEFPATTPRTPQPPRNDMSRLITLPPPYPRHHPAVNNNHPALSAIRQTLRSLTEHDEAAELKQNYASQRPTEARNLDSAASLAERKRDMRAQIHEQITSGAMSFADAAKAEAGFEEQEMKRGREAAQRDFDAFQTIVLSPLSSFLAEKITKSSASIEQLSNSLVDAARSRDPTLTQEEGDEEPELLEKLTLMKWFFEGREQLHKDLFELQGESDDKYKQVILTPYRLTGNQDKINEVEAFFVKDLRDRKLAHDTRHCQRFEAFLKIVEANVTRGVEDQLSAFWDIAPSLLDTVQRVPRNLHGFDLYIPPPELAENPSYRTHPLQYLFTLLLHAQKSTYQFIEAQTNLLCLLHEVKTAVMVAGCRLMETQRGQAGEDYAAVEREMAAIRAAEDLKLTSDLKERVELAEDQWRSALGDGLAACRSRIEEFLVEQGGWDESLVD